MHRIFFCLYLINLCCAFNLMAMDAPEDSELILAARQTQEFKAKRQEAKKSGSVEMVNEPVLDAVVQGIAGSVLAEETIISLSLFVNGSKGVDHIAKLLKEIRHLKMLKIVGKNIERKSMLTLAKAIEKNTSLNDLMIIFSNLNNEALSDFSTALQTNQNLHFVSFEGNFDLIGIRDSALAFCNHGIAPNNLGRIRLVTNHLPEKFETTLPEAFNKVNIQNGIVLNKIVKRKSNGSPGKRRRNMVKRDSEPNS